MYCHVLVYMLQCTYMGSGYGLVRLEIQYSKRGDFLTPTYVRVVCSSDCCAGIFGFPVSCPPPTDWTDGG